jgi:hypothetical protein
MFSTNYFIYQWYQEYYWMVHPWKLQSCISCWLQLIWCGYLQEGQNTKGLRNIFSSPTQKRHYLTYSNLHKYKKGVHLTPHEHKLKEDGIKIHVKWTICSFDIHMCNLAYICLLCFQVSNHKLFIQHLHI